MRISHYPRLPVLRRCAVPFLGATLVLSMAAAPALAQSPATPAAPGEPQYVNGDTIDLTPPAPDQPQPKFAVDREICNAEPTWRGQQSKFSYRIRNDGAGVLNIKVKACCGLTIAGKLGMLGWHLPPGATLALDMSMLSSGRDEFTRKVQVHTNDPQNPKVTLTCVGRTRVPFESEPPHLDLGTVPRDSGPITKSVTVTRGEAGPLKPTLGEVSDSRLTARLQEVTPGEVYLLEITVGPPWPNGEYRGYVTLEPGIPDVPGDKIRVLADVVPRLRTEPETFVLPADASAAHDVRLKLVWDGPPARVLSVTPADPSLRATLDADGSGVTLHVPAGFKLGGPAKSYVAITSDDPIAKVIRVQIETAEAAAKKAASEKQDRAPRKRP